MNSAVTPTHAAPAVYRRQTPTIWQALGQRLWRVLEQTGQRRAARDLRALAERWEGVDAPLARQLREAARFDTTSSKQDTP